MRILNSIQNHGDLVLLEPKQRQALCSEIREYLVDSVSKTGGHVASNLGVVELTVAIETVYNTEPVSVVVPDLLMTFTQISLPSQIERSS